VLENTTLALFTQLNNTNIRKHKSSNHKHKYTQPTLTGLLLQNTLNFLPHTPHHTHVEQLAVQSGYLSGCQVEGVFGGGGEVDILQGESGRES
jgi:hypothetical protein